MKRQPASVNAMLKALTLMAIGVWAEGVGVKLAFIIWFTPSVYPSYDYFDAAFVTASGIALLYMAIMGLFFNRPSLVSSKPFDGTGTSTTPIHSLYAENPDTTG